MITSTRSNKDDNDRIALAELIDYGCPVRVVNAIDEKLGLLWLDQLKDKYGLIRSIAYIGDQNVNLLCLAIGRRLLGMPTVEHLDSDVERRKLDLLIQRIGVDAVEEIEGA